VARAKAAEGIYGAEATYGYQRESGIEGRRRIIRLVPHEFEAVVVRRIFETSCGTGDILLAIGEMLKIGGSSPPLLAGTVINGNSPRDVWKTWADGHGAGSYFHAWNCVHRPVCRGEFVRVRLRPAFQPSPFNASVLTTVTTWGGDRQDPSDPPRLQTHENRPLEM
jgi:hypothetical protein